MISLDALSKAISSYGSDCVRRLDEWCAGFMVGLAFGVMLAVLGLYAAIQPVGKG